MLSLLRELLIVIIDKVRDIYKKKWSQKGKFEIIWVCHEMCFGAILGAPQNNLLIWSAPHVKKLQTPALLVIILQAASFKLIGYWKFNHLENVHLIEVHWIKGLYNRVFTKSKYTCKSSENLERLTLKHCFFDRAEILHDLYGTKMEPKNVQELILFSDY